MPGEPANPRPSPRRKRATRAAGSPAKRNDDARAARFARTRKDHASETAEDYVELISELIAAEGEARMTEIARRLGVSHVTVNKTLARLQREGLVQSRPYRSIFLTEKGARLAHASRARHVVVVRVLRKLGVSAADAEVDAEGIEHHLSPGTLEAFRRFLGEES